MSEIKDVTFESDPVEIPSTKWSCGVESHNHQYKSDASECISRRAEKYTALAEDIQVSFNLVGENYDIEDVGSHNSTAYATEFPSSDVRLRFRFERTDEGMKDFTVTHSLHDLFSEALTALVFSSRKGEAESAKEIHGRIQKASADIRGALDEIESESDGYLVMVEVKS